MPLNTRSPIVDLKGNPMKAGNHVVDGALRPDPTSDDFLIRDAVAEAMLGKTPEETQEGYKSTASAELRKSRIAMRFADNAILDELADEDRDFILDRAFQTLPTLIYGRLYDALHNATPPVADQGEQRVPHGE